MARRAKKYAQEWKTWNATHPPHEHINKRLFAVISAYTLGLDLKDGNALSSKVGAILIAVAKHAAPMLGYRFKENP